MQHWVNIQCPYCSETVEIGIEADLRGELVQDCEVCCRPWAMWVESNDAGEPQVSVERAQ